MTAYLLFHMREFDYTIYGIVRKNSAAMPFLLQYIEYLEKLEIGSSRKLVLLVGDITDQVFILGSVMKSQPDEIYNFAAQSQVAHSFENAASTLHANAQGLLHICTSILTLNMEKKVKIFHASTSEMYGDVDKR